EKIKTYQVEDFETIFRLSQDRPTIVRLLDPPLHEFLPSSEEDINNVSQQLNVSSEFLRKRIVDLNEVNAMLGHRGCRLAVTYPELYEMQVEAIIESVIKLDPMSFPFNKISHLFVCDVGGPLFEVAVLPHAF
ncbi:putative PEP-binding protein, partial [Bradyrhizobium sp.]|uniref:putative PEP-binding protein n=1 Tax=Bradyrhizobium sp. TaxID=376 RepID=UPI0028FFDCEA